LLINAAMVVNTAQITAFEMEKCFITKKRPSGFIIKKKSKGCKSQ
jgi:hypothetical protein